MTGMGEVTPIGDPVALAEAITRILEQPDDYLKPRSFIEDIFSLDRTVSAYEALFDGLAPDQAQAQQRAEVREA
jgi:hypothetical protein